MASWLILGFCNVGVAVLMLAFRDISRFFCSNWGKPEKWTDDIDLIYL
jgi:hypothetical protein